MASLEYWIWFASLRGVREKTRRALLDRFESPRDVFFADRRELARLELSPAELEALEQRDLHAADGILARCEELDVRVLTMQDAAYPQRLRAIPEPPAVLYVSGRLPDVDGEPVVALVGTRHSSPYGDKMARSIAYELASKGAVVATGLAGGIDSRAAEGALMAGGRVIGVLGVAINDVYPRWNGRLYDDVRASGALVSEYPPDAKGTGAWFPMRNRILAGLSLGVAVCEAPERSGALITAHRALDYGRDVFAVPGNADAAGFRGSNNLLREGAIIAESGADILREYAARFPDKIRLEADGAIPEGAAIPEETRRAERTERKKEKPEPPGKGFLKLRVPTKRKKQTEAAAVAAKPPAIADQLAGLTENQLKIVGVMAKPNMHVDDIIDLSALPASAVLSELTILQIKGFVSQSPGKRFTLNITK